MIKNTRKNFLALAPLLAVLAGCETTGGSGGGALIGGRKSESAATARQQRIEDAQFAETRREMRISNLESTTAGLRNELDSISDSLNKAVAKSENNSRSANSDTRLELAKIRDDINELRRKIDAMPGQITGIVESREKSMIAYVDKSVKDSEARSAAAIRAIKPAPAPAPAPNKTGGRTYTGEAYAHTVKAGETLSEIAQAYGVTVKEIQSANSNLDPSKIRVGQVINVPKK
jgi:FOG: LysM repeat